MWPRKSADLDRRHMLKVIKRRAENGENPMWIPSSFSCSKSTLEALVSEGKVKILKQENNGYVCRMLVEYLGA